jgi:signal transduction histidine kinase
MQRLSLRARLVAAFVGIAVLATLVAAVLTSVGLHDRFDAYVDDRTRDAAASSLALTQAAYAESGRWTPASLDLLAHELVLTGYDFRLVSGGRTLLDTTKLARGDAEFRRVAAQEVVSPAGQEVGVLELFALGADGNTEADDAFRAELDRAHVLAAVIAAVVAIIAGLVMAGRLSRPLRRLSWAARGLASGGGPPDLPGGSREIRELGESLSGLAEDLARQQRARLQLAQDLSHELRTPLALIQSRIEAMQDGVLPYDADQLATLHTETLRLSRLIGQIERLAEAEARPSPLGAEPVDLDELARSAHGALAAAFEMRGLVLEIDAPVTRAVGDRDAVLQIITNLLSNALKYAPDASVVRLTTSTEGDLAVLRVHDEGSSLRSSDRTRVFDRFHRGAGAAEMSGGAGLGLTIARELAVAQRGSLVLHDGGRTCFVLTLPAATGQPAGGPPGAGARAAGDKRVRPDAPGPGRTRTTVAGGALVAPVPPTDQPPRTGRT